MGPSFAASEVQRLSGTTTNWPYGSAYGELSRPARRRARLRRTNRTSESRFCVVRNRPIEQQHPCSRVSHCFLASQCCICGVLFCKPSELRRRRGKGKRVSDSELKLGAIFNDSLQFLNLGVPFFHHLLHPMVLQLTKPLPSSKLPPPPTRLWKKFSPKEGVQQARLMFTRC